MSKHNSSILVTGGTQGLGYECTLDLARRLPDTLIIASARTDPNNAVQKINTTLRQSNVIFMHLDLSALETVRTFVQTWKDANHPPIRAIVMNAGIQFPEAAEFTVDGIEMSFGVNHVGHALLFHLLTPYLISNARIVITSSGVHNPDEPFGFKPLWPSVEEVANPSAEFQKEVQGRDRYAISKVANVMWTYALARRLTAQGEGKTVVTMDPGLMPGTNLGRHYTNPLLKLVWYKIMPRILPLLRMLVHPNIHSPAESGQALAWLAVDEACKEKTGLYYEGKVVKESSKHSRVEETQDKLWEWTIKFVARTAEEREAFSKVQ